MDASFHRLVDLLAGSPEIDLVATERVLALLGRQAHTVADFPRVRPSDCAMLTSALEKAMETNRSVLLLGDAAIARRFDSILEAYVKTDVKFYPRELFRARLLHAEARILLNDFGGAREAAAPYLDHPFALEGGVSDLLELFSLDCRIQAATRDAGDVARRATLYALALMRLSPGSARKILARMWPFIGLGAKPGLQAGPWRRRLHAVGAAGLAARRGSGLRAMPLQLLLAAKATVFGSFYLFAAHVSDSRAKRRAGSVLATRAMGGIGDLLMMTPGLRALAMRTGRPVKFAIPRKFSAVFANNPNVELLDVDRTPFELTESLDWRNLTICPAGAYEARRRPFVKKSRVELFALGLGVRRAELDRCGWNVELHLDDAQEQFAESFLRSKSLGDRPLVGVQPYSRDSYKDHPGMVALIEDLARDFDVVVFHHAAANLPSGAGIATTAGLALSQSLALVSRLDAMVSGDSAFMHAAGAFDVPVFGLFGPTDGSLFTRHHRFATVYQNKAVFPCSPCWRNEDLPCKVTGRVGVSPCMASLDLQHVRMAVMEALSRRAPRATALSHRSLVPGS